MAVENSSSVTSAFTLLRERLVDLDRIRDEAIAAHNTFLAQLSENKRRAQDEYVDFATEHCVHSELVPDNTSYGARRWGGLLCLSAVSK